MPNLRSPFYRVLLIVVALMSGPLSLVREILQFTNSAKYPDRPLFTACLFVAFMAAMFLLWRDEHQAKLEAEKRLNDERPILGINTEGIEGRNAWKKTSVPVVFSIQHLSGRLPTAIRLDPVLSKQGKFSLHFDALPHVDHPPQRTAIGFEVMQVGVPQLSAIDWEATRPHQKELLGLFLDDSPMELIKIDWNVVMHFLDGADERTQRFILIFDRQRWRFSVAPEVVAL
jgi:hypothetical protein